MNSKLCFLVLAFAFLGASASPLVSTASTGLNNIHGLGGVGSRVSETLITPYRRTDSVSTPYGHSVVHTTPVAGAVGSHGLGGGVGFLGTGTGTGVYPGGVAGGFCSGVHQGVISGGLVGTGAGVHAGLATGGLVTGGLATGGLATGGLFGAGVGAYNNVGYNGAVGGVGNSGILSTGWGSFSGSSIAV